MNTNARPREVLHHGGTIIKPRLIYQPKATPDHPYNVQLHMSTDGGKTFCYTGNGKSFKDYYEAEAYRKQHRENLTHDLMFGGLGNGTTVCNRAREVNGDYQTIAHISDCGAIYWYVDKLPPYAIREIEDYARRVVEIFRNEFMVMSRTRALHLFDQFMTVVSNEIYTMPIEGLYDAYIRYMCEYGHYTMPTETER